MKTAITIDKIWIDVVPKAVDTTPEIFRDKKTYFSHAEQQINEFWKRLPQGYVQEVKAQRFPKEKAALFITHENPYTLMLGFKPGYNLLRATKTERDIIVGNSRNITSCPLFDLCFTVQKDIDPKIVLEAALQQFYLYQFDLPDGSLAAKGYQSKRIVLEELALLRHYLPTGTSIEARCDFALGNGQTKYIL